MAHLDPESLSGSEKVAILMLVLGTELSSSIFKALDEEDVKKVSQAISRLGTVNDDLTKYVLNDTYQGLMGNPKIHGNLDFVKKLIESSFDPEEAQNIIHSVSLESGNERQGLAIVRRADPRQLVNLLQKEHPQTIALVISNLKVEQAAQTLSLLPDEMRSEVSMRMARLDQTKQSLRDRVLGMVAARLGGGGLYDRAASGSVRSVAEILNRMEHSVGSQCLNMIEGEDPTLALAIRDLMFVFDDILMAGDHDMRKIIQRVDKTMLVRALKGAHGELREHFFRNMSERARGMLQEDMEALGPIPLSEAESSQQEVVKEIREMEKEGDIDLSGKAGDQYVV